jgi:hypothetical protein
VFQLQITNRKLQILVQVSEQQCCSKKDLAIARRGVARSEIRALSGAGIGDLVALETLAKR